MRYTIKAHPTTYSGVRFRSRLEARWAAFFDLAGWTWQYEPVDLVGWSPDFAVTFKCREDDTENSQHAIVLYVEVKPYTHIEQFHDHTAWSMIGYKAKDGPEFDTSRIAVFGISPVVSYWEDLGCIHCGGEYNNIQEFIPTWSRLWKDAGNRVQWRAA